MPPVATCPDRQVLQRFRLGDLPEAEAEMVIQHLAQCPACVQTVHDLSVDDTLLEAIRRGSVDTIDETLSQEVEGLIERLCRVPALAESTGELTPADPSGGTAAAAATPTIDSTPGRHVREMCDFLSPPQTPDELGRLGAYRVLQVLGSGGMGVVFLAEDRHLGRLVALKAMLPTLAASPSARERFLREARATAAVKHDHIVTIYHVGEDRGVPFLAMELLEGEPLDERLRREKQLPIQEALRIGRDAAWGLAAAHRRGLLHRDIKPANIWLEAETGRVKILDFGLARAVGEESHLTQQGAIVGTPAYIAPEQAGGKAVDGRCDLFSLGCVLYRMTTGQPPFKGPDTLSTLMSVANDQPPAPRELNPDVPTALSDLIVRLLAKQPDQRPASAQAAVEELRAIEQALAAAPAEPARPTPPALPKKPPHPRTADRGVRRRTLIAAAVLLALAPIALVYGGTIVRFVTNRGVLVVEINDPSVEVTIKDGAAVIHQTTTNRRYTLTPGDYEIEVREEGEGGARFTTKKFTLTRGEIETLNARLELTDAKPTPKTIPQPGQPQPAVGDPDRRVAEWVLSVGGMLGIAVDGQVREGLTSVAQLPEGPFQIHHLYILPPAKIDDDALDNLRGLTGVAYHFWLQDQPITDAGLAKLAEMPGLAATHRVHFDNSKITDAGLVHLKRFRGAAFIGLGGASVTGVGLKHLRELPQLSELSLIATPVTDAGLAELKGLPLIYLALDHCPNITDAGLEHVGALTTLQNLHLRITSIGDSGLEHLKHLADLRVLALYGCPRVTGKGLESLRGLKKLGHLDLTGTSVADADLIHLRELPELASLALGTTPITDAGLEHLQDLKQLKELHLVGTNITDTGLERLRNLGQLKLLDLNVTGVTDEGLTSLRELSQLHYLRLDVTAIGDAGLEHLKELKQLRTLSVLQTKVTVQGVQKLHAALPQCQIESDHGLFEPMTGQP